MNTAFHIEMGKDIYLINTEPLVQLGFLTSSITENYISFVKIDKDKEGDFITYIFIRKDKRWYYNSIYKNEANQFTRGLTIEETEAALKVLKSLTFMKGEKNE